MAFIAHVKSTKALVCCTQLFYHPSAPTQVWVLPWWSATTFPAIPPHGNAMLDSTASEILTEPTAIVSPVCSQAVWSGAWTSPVPGNADLRQCRLGLRHIMSTSIRQVQRQRNAVPVAYRVHLARCAATGAAGQIAAPFALIYDPSSAQCFQSNFFCVSSSASADRQIRSQVPSADHVRNRRHAVTYDPYAVGRSFHRHPVFNTYSMPSIVRRSSARGRPVDDFGGNNGPM